MGARPMEGRRVAVTGGARGLGYAIAARLLADGAAVAILDVDADAAGRACEQLSAAGTVVPVAADVRKSDSVTTAIEAGAQQLDGLDGLVNNAGIVRDGPLEQMSDADWDDVLEIDLRGYFYCCRAAAPLLRAAAPASIVNLSSRAYLGNPGQANYSAAKAGVVGLTRSLSMELGPAGITVNAIAPGVIDTDLVRNHPKADAIRARAEKTTPLRRLGRPEEVASTAAFLLSPDAGYLTGEILHVSGGRR